MLLFELQSRAGAYSSPVWQVLELLALFFIVTLHEFGHALACRSVGGHADHILLWPFGGIAFVDTPPRPGATLWTIAAGPLVNVALIPVLWEAVRWAGPGPSDLASFAMAVAAINLGLLAFNLFPVYPLDGGQILHALLWFPLGRARSLMATVVIGFAGVGLMMLWAVRGGDLWLGGITVFILLYCWSGLKRALGLWRLAKLPKHEGLACPWCQASPPAAPVWRCAACHHEFDIFAARGACPQCSARAARTCCPECFHCYPMEAWAGAAAASVSL